MSSARSAWPHCCISFGDCGTAWNCIYGQEMFMLFIRMKKEAAFESHLTYMVLRLQSSILNGVNLQDLALQHVCSRYLHYLFETTWFTSSCEHFWGPWTFSTAFDKERLFYLFSYHGSELRPFSSLVKIFGSSMFQIIIQSGLT